jgi:iron complex outermembrane receptor protein
MIAHRIHGTNISTNQPGKPRGILHAALAIAAVTCAAPGSAGAQEANAPSAAPGTAIEEIVVTARRRNEDIQTVPIAITALSSNDLRTDRIETVADLVQFVPALVALNATNRDSNQLSIRGVPGVVAYFAEAPVISALSAAGSGSGSGSGAGLYYDLQGVQILKGPQSTLFGGTTTGGAILFEPKKPTGNYEGYGQITLGDYNDRELEGAVNIPIIADKLLVRVAGQTQQRDGYTTDIISHKDLDNRDYYAARIGVTFQPADDVDNYFVYSSYFTDTNGTGEKLTAVNPNSVTALAFGQAAFQALALQTALGPRQTALDTPEISKEYTFRFTDIAQWRMSDQITLRNIAAYTESKYLFRWDLDGSPLPLIGSTNPTNWSNSIAAYSEELQLQGKSFNDTLIWTAGGFLQFIHPAGYSYVQSIEFDTPINTVIHNPLTTAGTTTTKEQALYAQATYDLGSAWDLLSGLKATGGYRYSWDYASNLQNNYDGLNLCQADQTQSVPNCGSAISGHFNQGTWTAALDYQVTPGTLVYATGRRGYNPGGFNVYAPTPDERKYQPEHLIDVEVGVKSDWTLWGAPGRVTLDGFHDHYTNIQRNVAVVGNGISTITENAALATLEGIEFEGRVVPIKNIELSGLYAYANSRYDEYQSPSAGNLSGLPFTGGPRNQYSATGKYHLPVADRLGDVSLSASYSWQAHIQFSDRELGGVIPSHGLVNLRMDWDDVAGRPLDASFFMTNATDQTYIAGGTVVYNALGVNPVIYGEPRMWGFQLRYRFGPNGHPDL